jgi:replicative DNA helicase
VSGDLRTVSGALRASQSVLGDRAGSDHMTEQPIMPTANDDAERAVLGACFQGRRWLDEAAGMLRPEMFYGPRNGTVFQAMLAMREVDRTVDPITLVDWLGRDEVQRLGGLPFIHDLHAAVVIGTDVAFHAEIVRDCAARRGILALAQRMAQRTTSSTDPVPEVIDRCWVDLENVAQQTRGNLDTYSTADLVVEALGTYAEPEVEALPTGWLSLDEMLNGGLRPGQLIVVAARPGLGKSIVGANVSRHLSSIDRKVLFISLEMRRKELMDRIVADVASVELPKLIRHQLTSFEWGRVQEAAQKMKDWRPISIADTPSMRLANIRSVAREQARAPDGLDLLVVDYLGLTERADPRQDDRQHVSATSRGLKILARELDVPVLAMHQLNRNSETRIGKKPMLADMRDSGAVEQDADIAILLHREDDPTKRGFIDLIVAKQRQGPTGVVRLRFQGAYGRLSVGALSEFDPPPEGPPNLRVVD